MTTAMTTFFSIREKFFIEKTALFLKGFEDIDENFKNKFNKVTSDQKSKEDLEARRISALDRFDELAKADALFKVFVAYINNEIGHQEFLRYLYVLDKIDFSKVEDFRSFYNSSDEVISDSSMNSFAFVGLLQLMTRVNITVFGKNDFGKKFLKILGLLE